MAALKTGELDFVLDPSVQDVLRLRNDPDIKINALKMSVMRGLSIPTGIPLPAGLAAGVLGRRDSVTSANDSPGLAQKRDGATSAE